MAAKRSLSNQKLAELSPRAYLRTSAFWWTHRDMMLRLALGGASVLWLLAVGWPEEEVLRSALGGGGMVSLEALNWIFTFLMLFAAVWGVRAALRALSDLGVNRAVAVAVEGHAESRLRGLATIEGGRMEVRELWSLLPNNVSKPVPAMMRLCQQVCKEAQSRRFESSVHLVQPYRDESLGQLGELERVQKFALRIGILGTFIGLLLAIAALPGALPPQGFAAAGTEEMGMVLARDLQEGQANFLRLSRSLLGSLGLAFSTSAVGLGIAVFIASLAEAVRRRQTLYFKEMEDATITLVALASRSLNRDGLLAGLEQAGQAMKEVELQVYDQTRKLEKGMSDIGERIAIQTARIGEGLQDLARAKGELEGFLQHLTEAQKAFLDDLRSLYEAASMRRLFAGVENTLLLVQENVSRQVETGLGRVSDELDGLQGSMEKVSREVDTLRQDVSGKVQVIQGSLRKVENRVSESVERSQLALSTAEATMRRSNTSDSAPFSPKHVLLSSVGGSIVGVGFSPEGAGLLGALMGAMLAPLLIQMYRQRR